MKTCRFLIAGFFVFALLGSLYLAPAPLAQAQSDEGWTDPINLSNSGSSSKPAIVIDSNGAIHVFWLDDIDGYKYVTSADGVKWSPPKTVQAPFPLKTDPQLLLLAGDQGTIHILWKNSDDSLQYSSAQAASLGDPLTWNGPTSLADNVVSFSAAVDSQGALHVAYLNNKSTDTSSAGVFYRRLAGSSWSEAKGIYPSNYFRSLVPESANLHLVTSTVADKVNVYIVWDDRFQRRIFLARSADGGEAWDDLYQIRGPEDFPGLELPYNVNLGVMGDQVQLIWQEGVPGGDCIQYSLWSTNGVEQLGQPQRMLDDTALCPLTSQFVVSKPNFSIILIRDATDLSLMAWNGTAWSKEQVQSDIVSFINPVTLGSVFLGCQNVSFYKDRIYVVGCDTGGAGDIWFTSRSIDTINEWFPPPSSWDRPTVLADSDQKISDLITLPDSDNNIHGLWIQTVLLPDGQPNITIQYARWNGDTWSEPTPIISQPQWSPSQLRAGLDNSGKLFVVWVDDVSGDMFFSWADANGASSASEWKEPIYIPSISQANSAPDVLTDASGRIFVVFAVTINEERGIYIVESDDLGVTWSQPKRIFDASQAKLDMVDQPQIAVTADGHLHLMFGVYSLRGEQRRSLGLDYAQSSDGGGTWTPAETVSERPVQWGELLTDGNMTLHRLWQEQGDSIQVILHQVSQDGGKTWSTPATLSTLNGDPIASKAAIDPFGNLHFLQLKNANGLSLVNQKWDGSSWVTEESKQLNISDPDIQPSFVAASVASKGDLVASLLINSLDLKTPWKYELLTLKRSLAWTGESPTPAPIIIPTVAAEAVTTPEAVSVTATPEQSPLAQVQDNNSFLRKYKNPVGLLLIGLVAGILFLIFRPRSNAKKSS